MANEQNLPEPITRKEKYLAKAAGMEVIDLPEEPLTREEKYLAVIAEGGGGDSYTKEETNALLAVKADLVNGVIPANQIPPEVFERMKVVDDDTARFALTKADVQNGDIVYVNATQIMYYVYDDTKLDVEAGYKPFAAGTAAKAIADKNGADITSTYQTITLGSWAAGSATSHSTPASTDTVLEALEKIDNNQRLDETNISTEQGKTVGMTAGGSNYITVGGIRVYVSATEPTGDIPDGSVGVGW